MAIGLSSNWTNSTVTILINSKPDGVPSLNSPSLWYYGEANSLYTGFSGLNSTFVDLNNNTSVVPPLSLWSFRLDGNGGGEWDQVINASSSAWGSLKRPVYSLQAQSPDTAFILGGSELRSNNLDNLLGGMVQYNMQSRTFVNTSAPCCNATDGLLRGAMHYIPSFGPEGIILAMGGQNSLDRPDGQTSFIDFSFVSVFDTAKQAWWNQTTTGNPPIRRKEFCMAGINSTDSTYEMYQDVCHLYIGWPKLTLVLDSCTLAGMVLADLALFLLTLSISSPYLRSTGSKFPTIHGILAMATLAMLSEAARYL